MARPLTAVTGRTVGPRAELIDQLIEDHAAVLNEHEGRTHADIERIASELVDTLTDRASIIGIDAAASQAKAQKAIDEALDLYQEAHAEVRSAIQKGARRAAVERTQQVAETFTDAAIRPAALAIEFATLSPAQVRELVARPYFGWTTIQWTEWHSTKDAARIDRELRASYLAGEGMDTVARRLRKAVDMTRNESKVLARTAINSASNQAATELYRRNRDVVSGIRWVATLDDRTCPQCGPLDGRRFDLEQGPRPPAHPQCRCMTIPDIRKGILPGSNPNIPAWGEWITGEFGNLNPEQVAARQVRVLGRTTANLIQAGTVGVSDLVTERGRRRNVRELVSLAERRAA